MMCGEYFVNCCDDCWVCVGGIEDSHNLSLYINDAVYTSGNNVQIR